MGKYVNQLKFTELAKILVCQSSGIPKVPPPPLYAISLLCVLKYWITEMVLYSIGQQIALSLSFTDNHFKNI
jgi:hypothetical protein